MEDVATELVPRVPAIQVDTETKFPLLKEPRVDQDWIKLLAAPKTPSLAVKTENKDIFLHLHPWPKLRK